MSAARPDPSALLRAHGLRSTLQRRAILAAFTGRADEHLSADEIHARAALELPDLGRGTVYAALAELTELGLLAAIGAPEPVRYETNIAPHDHFRCRLCLRTFDLAGRATDGEPAAPRGFLVERAETRLEGVCAECREYEAGLRAGARAIARSGEAGTAEHPGPLALAVTTSPLGALALAASADGLVRVAFEHHADFPRLAGRADGRRGGRAARARLREAGEQLHRYFAGASGALEAAVDGVAVPPPVVSALRAVPPGERRSYAALGLEEAPRALGRSFGGNPVPLFAPCHRVTRGIEVPRFYVGGPERRSWLLAHELTPGP